MKKIWKIVLAFAVVTVALVITLAVLVNVLITPERIKAKVLPLARQAVQRDVQLGEVEVSLFSGIVLHNLLVKEKSGDNPFMAVDQVVLRYRFWPLLFLRVVIDEIRLDAPKLTLVRQADGRFNYSDLMSETAAPPPEKELPASSETSEDRPIDLLVSKLIIEDGELQFVDHVNNDKAPYHYTMSDLNVRAQDLSLEEAFPFQVAARLNGSPLEIDGVAGLKTQSGKIGIRLDDFDVMPFSHYFSNLLPGKAGAIKLNLDVQAEGNAEALSTSGKIDFPRIDITLDAFPDAPFRNVKASLDYDLQIDTVRSTIRVVAANPKINDISLNLSGRIDDYANVPKVDLVAVLDKLDLRAAMAALPAELTKQVKTFDPAGQISARINLAGPVDQPATLLKQGEIQIDGVQASAGGVRPSLTGLVTLAGDRLTTEKMKLNIGDNSADIDIKASNLFGKPMVVYNRVTSEEFSLDPLLKAGSEPVVATDKKGEVSTQEKTTEIGPFDLPLTVDGGMDIGRTLYRGLTIEDFKMRYRLVDNQLKVETLTGKVAGGTFNKTATVDLAKKGLVYHANLNLAGVKADPLVKAFAPKAADTVFGTLSLDAKFDGRGTLPETFRKNLSGNGKLLLVDGRLTGSSLVQGLADFIKLDELRDLRFDQVTGNFTIKNGQISINSDFNGKDVRMAPSGTIGLDEKLNLQLNTWLSPQLTGRLDKKGDVAKFFTDSEGWGELPLKLSGTLSKPQFAFDSSAVGKKVRTELKRALEEKVFKKPATTDGNDQTNEPAKQLLENSLKKFFGK